MTSHNTVESSALRNNLDDNVFDFELSFVYCVVDKMYTQRLPTRISNFYFSGLRNWIRDVCVNNSNRNELLKKKAFLSYKVGQRAGG